MGTPEFAVPALDALIHSVHQIVGVFVQPDEPAGRGRIVLPPPVKKLALQHHHHRRRSATVCDRGWSREQRMRLALQLQS